MPFKDIEQRRASVRKHYRKWISNPENREKHNALRRQQRAERRPEKECIVCHRIFKTPNRQKTCSPKCSKALRAESEKRCRLNFLQANPHYARNRLRERKTEFVQLMGGKCQVCGYSKTIVALEFHHINGNDDKPSASELGNLKQFRQKIADGKMALLCANCHREAHNGDWYNRVRRGL